MTTKMILMYITTQQDAMSIVSDWPVGAFSNDPCLNAWSILLSYHTPCCTRTQDITLLL